MGILFGHIVQCDLLFLWECIFILLIDECTRYKFVGRIMSKSFEHIQDSLLNGWFRCFGPPRVFLSDQESAIAGE